MIKKSLDQGRRGINELSMKLFISIKENIKFLLLNHTTVVEIVVKMVNEFRERLALALL
jgi:hypothetical protein